MKQLTANREFLDRIIIDQLREFTEEALAEHTNDEKMHFANKVCEVIIATLEKKKLITEHSHQSFVDVMIAATLLHNLFYTEGDWTTVFTARKELATLAIKHGIDDQVQEAIFATIESQLGEDMPVQNSRPKPGTPTEVFSNSVWFVGTYLTDKE